MQQEMHSYAFQLSEGYQGVSICCHPKTSEFIVANKSSDPNQQKSLIYSLQYEQQNPRKSLLTNRQVKGLVQSLFQFNDQSYLSVFKRSQQQQILLFQYTKQQQTQQVPQKSIGKSQENINNILKAKNNVMMISYQHRICTFDIEKPFKGDALIETQNSITFSTVDPIHQYLAYVTSNNKISITDKSCKKDKYTVESKGNQPILSIDFNPNKQYYLMAAYYDSLKFFDIRKGNIPVKCQEQHHSVVLNSKYNHSHDELVIVSYDDGTAGLLRIASVSSVPMAKDEDTMVKLYDQHEDSIYQLNWSYFSPWIFGSLGYSATNFVVNVVPSAQKYRILL